MLSIPNGGKPPAVLVGINSMQGLQAARLLKRHGIPIVGLTSQASHHANWSRSCDTIVVVPEDAEGLLGELESIGEQLTGPAFLLPCTDGSVRTVSKNRERLEGAYRFVLPPHSTVDRLGDKVGLVSFCHEYDLPIPDSTVLASDADVDRAISTLSFPAVLKPARRTAEWIKATKIKAIKVQSAEEVRAVWDRWKHLGVPFVVQRWIDGADSELYSCNAYFDRDGALLASFVAKKLRQWPLRVGQSSLGVECRDDTVLNLAVNFFAAARYRGLAYLEVKKERSSGRYFIIEPNVARPTGRSAIAEAGGVELLLTAYSDALSLPLPQERTQAYGAAKWIHVRRDTQAAWSAWRAGDLTIKEWRESIRGVNCFAVWSARDPMPFFIDLIHTLRALITTIPRQRARGRLKWLALIGVDGSGKTTVGKALCDRLPVKTKQVYMGTNLESSKVLLPTSWLLRFIRRRRVVGGLGGDDDAAVRARELLLSNRVRNPQRGRLGAVLRLGHRLSESTFRSLYALGLSLSGTLVVCDRHLYYENLSRKKPGNLSQRRLTDRIFLWYVDHVLPRPDLVVLLDVPGSLAYARKPELSIVDFEDRRRALQACAARDPGIAVIDGSEPVAMVVDKISRILEQHNLHASRLRLQRGGDA